MACAPVGAWPSASGGFALATRGSSRYDPAAPGQTLRGCHRPDPAARGPAAGEPGTQTVPWCGHRSRVSVRGGPVGRGLEVASAVGQGRWRAAGACRSVGTDGPMDRWAAMRPERVGAGGGWFADVVACHGSGGFAVADVLLIALDVVRLGDGGARPPSACLCLRFVVHVAGRPGV